MTPDPQELGARRRVRYAMVDSSENTLHQDVARRRGGAGLWLLAGGVGIVVLAVGFGVFRGPGSSDGQDRAAGASDWFDVSRQSFDLTVVAAGDLEAKNKVVIRNQVQQRGTIISDVVEEGIRVKKGDVLVRLDDSQTRDRMQQEELSVQKAEADVVAAQQALDIGISKADSDRQTAELTRDLARLSLDKWEAGDVQQKRNDLLLAKDTAGRTVEQATRDYELSADLFAQQFISASELDSDDIRKLEAEGRLATAQIASDVYEAYTHPMEKQQFNSNREQAEEELARTIQTNASTLSQLQASLKSKQSSLMIRQVRLAEYKREIEFSVMRAPLDGLVVYATSGQSGRGRHSNSTTPIQQGRAVTYNEPIIIIPDTRQMVAVLRVHESMLPNVKVGQSVALHLDVRPGAPLPGTVTSIAVMAARSSWLNPQLREYEVRIELPPEIDSMLKPSMRCTGEIVIGHVENAIAVPLHTVFTEGKRRYCYVRASRRRVERRAVKVGRSSDLYVEVLGGLNEGDKVLLRAPLPGEIRETEQDRIARKESKNAETEPTAAQPPANPNRPRGGGLQNQAGGQPGGQASGQAGGDAERAARRRRFQEAGGRRGGGPGGAGGDGGARQGRGSRRGGPPGARGGGGQRPGAANNAEQGQQPNPQ